MNGVGFYNGGSNTWFVQFYGTKSGVASNYFELINNADTIAFKGNLDFTGVQEVIGLAPLIPSQAANKAVFVVSETSGQAGAAQFIVGTRGGAVSTILNNIGVLAPANTGDNDWLILAGTYKISVSANYVGTSVGAMTVLTKFGTEPTITGDGNATNLYFTPSKTESGTDAIGGTHTMYIVLTQATRFYLTRFAGSGATTGSAQISPNSDFQIEIEKIA